MTISQQNADGDLTRSLSPKIDVHVVARRASPQTLAQLTALGFDRKTVVDGDPRVRMEYLLSLKSADLQASDDDYSRAVAICEADKDFYGYIEQEIISSDVTIISSANLAGPEPDMQFEVSPCPQNLYKSCDLHFAVKDAPPSLRALMRKHDFYHLVLNKDGLGDVTIFTMQLEQVTQGHELWNVMVAYLEGCPGINCAAKFEVTRNLARFGDYPLPPLVLKHTLPRFMPDGPRPLSRLKSEQESRYAPHKASILA